jgi:hypothetical protein
MIHLAMHSEKNVQLDKKVSLNNGVSGEIRTPDPQLRRLLLYPTELLRHSDGSGGGA